VSLDTLDIVPKLSRRYFSIPHHKGIYGEAA